MRRTAIRTHSAAVVLAALALTACDRSSTPLAAPARELNVYSWSDFFAPDVLADFEKESGIRDNLVIFPSQEALEATLLTGHSGYDVAVVASSALSRLKRAHVFRELDRSKLSNWTGKTTTSATSSRQPLRIAATLFVKHPAPYGKAWRSRTLRPVQANVYAASFEIPEIALQYAVVTLGIRVMFIGELDWLTSVTFGCAGVNDAHLIASRPSIQT